MSASTVSPELALLRPQPQKRPFLAVARLAELDDPRWLRDAYERHGDPTIARLLGVDRKTVSAARHRLGITSKPTGRRHGVTTVAAEHTLTLVRVTQRFNNEARPSGPAPTEMLLANRIRALHHASVNADEPAYDDALLAIGSAAALIYEHRQKLRAA